MFFTCFPENLVKKLQKTSSFQLSFCKLCSTKIGKNIEFLAFFEKMLAQNVQKTHVFLQFLQIHLVEKR